MTAKQVCNLITYMFITLTVLCLNSTSSYVQVLKTKTLDKLESKKISDYFTTKDKLEEDEEEVYCEKVFLTSTKRPFFSFIERRKWR